jgi:uncharacterized phosphatase
MTIAFIRHGQTDWNAEGRMQGSTDIPLNDVGRQQAREAAQTLLGGEWDVIVSSPLQRARETASIIAGGLGIEVGRSYDSLVERHYGAGEGLTIDEIDARWPDHKFPQLEPLESVVARGTAALNEISEEHAGRRVVIVCHGTIIRYTLASLTDQPVDRILNGSISTLRRADAAWQVLSVNGVDLQLQSV